MKKNLNQNLINLIEYYSLFNANILLSNKPLKRTASDQNMSFSGSKPEKLEKLKNSIKNIKNCDLKKNAKNLVFGDGNINSKIMIIGEGPGANEDAEGKPFVGRAGKLLDKMLAAIKLDRLTIAETRDFISTGDCPLVPKKMSLLFKDEIIFSAFSKEIGASAKEISFITSA